MAHDVSLAGIQVCPEPVGDVSRRWGGDRGGVIDDVAQQPVRALPGDYGGKSVPLATQCCLAGAEKRHEHPAVGDAGVGAPEAQGHRLLGLRGHLTARHRPALGEGSHRPLLPHELNAAGRGEVEDEGAAGAADALVRQLSASLGRDLLTGVQESAPPCEQVTETLRLALVHCLLFGLLVFVEPVQEQVAGLVGGVLPRIIERPGQDRRHPQGVLAPPGQPVRALGDRLQDRRAFVPGMVGLDSEEPLAAGHAESVGVGLLGLGVETVVDVHGATEVGQHNVLGMRPVRLASVRYAGEGLRHTSGELQPEVVASACLPVPADLVGVQQLLFEHCGVRRALLGIEVDAADQDRPDLRREVQLVEHLGEMRVVRGLAAGEDLQAQDAIAEYVPHIGQRLLALGRRVKVGAEVGHCLVCGRRDLRADLRDAEVGELRRAVLGQQHVVRLEVAVLDLQAVRVRERADQWPADPLEVGVPSHRPTL